MQLETERAEKETAHFDALKLSESRRLGLDERRVEIDERRFALDKEERKNMAGIMELLAEKLS